MSCATCSPRVSRTRGRRSWTSRSTAASRRCCDPHRRRMGGGGARRRRRPLRLRHPRRPQPRDLRRAAAAGEDHARARPPRGGRGVHGGRLRARLGRPRRRRRDHGPRRDEHPHAARRVVCRIDTGPRGDVGRRVAPGRPRGRRAPRSAEPDRVLPARDALGRGVDRGRRDPDGAARRLPPPQNRSPGADRHLDPERLLDGPGRRRLEHGRSRQATAVPRERDQGGRRPAAWRRQALDHRRRWRDRRWRRGRAPSARAAP